MKLKEIENKKTEIEKEVLKTEQQLDTLVVETATLEAQIKSKNRKVMDLTEQISSKRSELRKLEIAKEIILTPAQLDNTGEAEEEPKNTTDLKVGLIIRKAIGSKLKKDFMKSYTTIHQMKSLTN